MENVTGGGWTDYTQFTEYKVSDVMWKVFSPLILVVGTFGNVATILVMRRIKDNNSSQYAILMVLAVADLSVLYSALLDMWIFRTFRVYLIGYHTALCKLLFWATFASASTSAWLVTAVTVQRTMAVMWPHRMRAMCTVRRTWIVIAALVVTACCVHLHVLIGIHLTVESECYVSGRYGRFFNFIWRWLDMGMSSIVPSTCLFVCSIILSWTLFTSTSLSSSAVHATSNVNAGQPHDSRKTDAVKVTVMILSLSCTFLVLTLPVCMYDLWHAHAIVHTPSTNALAFLFYSLTYLMWFSNSAVNFLLYCVTGTRFRKEFMTLVLCGAKCHSAGETTAVTSRGEGRKR